jgi:hypothetical protein
MIWPRALESRAPRRLRVRKWMARAGHGALVIRAVDRAGLRSISVREHIRAASRKLEGMRAARRNEGHVPYTSLRKIKLCWPNARRDARSWDVAAVDHAMKMVLKVVRHVVVRRQNLFVLDGIICTNELNCNM